MSNTTILPSLIDRFFTQRLMQHCNASPHTIASYRDRFRLRLAVAQARLGKVPSALDLTDLDAPFVTAFLDALESLVKRYLLLAACERRSCADHPARRPFPFISTASAAWGRDRRSAIQDRTNGHLAGGPRSASPRAKGLAPLCICIRNRIDRGQVGAEDPFLAFLALGCKVL